MLDLGPHSTFIYLSFGLTAIAILAMLIWVYIEEAVQRGKVEKLEAQGITRQSNSPGSESLKDLG